MERKSRLPLQSKRDRDGRREDHSFLSDLNEPGTERKSLLPLRSKRTRNRKKITPSSPIQANQGIRKDHSLLSKLNEPGTERRSLLPLRSKRTRDEEDHSLLYKLNESGYNDPILGVPLKLRGCVRTFNQGWGAGAGRSRLYLTPRSIL